MYVPAAFAVSQEDAVALLEKLSFGSLVTQGPDGLTATHMPFIIETDPLRLVGHIARANRSPRAGQGEAMMVVQGPQAYVSPAYYPSKLVDGRVVPTWDYEAVHAYGVMAWQEDKERILSIVTRLTEKFEAGRSEPWSVTDAPGEYVDRLLGAIIGVELTITRVQGVRKLSQNRSGADQAGVKSGLAASQQPSDHAVAALISG